MGAGEVLARKVTVGGAYGVGGGEGIVGQPVVVRNGLDQLCGGFPARQLFAQEGVENRAAGVQGLKLVLNVQRREYIL